MVAVITGDIIASRNLVNQENWLQPLKSLFAIWGESPKSWIIERGDFFQVEIVNPEDAVRKALEIKAVIKKIVPLDLQKKNSIIDVRMAIGIGEKTYSSKTLSESNGTAFINSGEKFDVLKKEHITLGIKSPWQDFDDEMNLYLKLVGLFMDKWSVSSAELVEIILKNPKIKQSGVSRRSNRANVNEILEVINMYQIKINKYIQ